MLKHFGTLKILIEYMVDTTCRGLISKDEVEIKRLELELSKPAISIVREQKLNSLDI